MSELVQRLRDWLKLAPLRYWKRRTKSVFFDIYGTRLDEPDERMIPLFMQRMPPDAAALEFGRRYNLVPRREASDRELVHDVQATLERQKSRRHPEG